MFVGFLVFK